MNLSMDAERLSSLIQRFARGAQEARQVARRLADVLPSRFKDLKRDHAMRHKPAIAERLALTDQRYLEFVNELTTLHAQAREARIQYETHMMLLEARRSLRAFRA